MIGRMVEDLYVALALAREAASADAQDAIVLARRLGWLETEKRKAEAEIPRLAA